MNVTSPEGGANSLKSGTLTSSVLPSQNARDGSLHGCSSSRIVTCISSLSSIGFVEFPESVSVNINVTFSCISSASCFAVTVISRFTFQFDGVNVSCVGFTSRTVFACPVMVVVTSPEGCWLRLIGSGLEFPSKTLKKRSWVFWSSCCKSLNLSAANSPAYLGVSSVPVLESQRGASGRMAWGKSALPSNSPPLMSVASNEELASLCSSETTMR